ncbi:olfactory receptor 11L1-like [Emydura macquarii macquarii]|uniref:olfactory receptor 11L1-like n=1 Tax=Emydura macquarii macquarii TaxID=1129001 RepID=UPI00352A12CD
MAGNTLIIVIVVADQHLHTPMYFFLGNLSCLETCYSSTIMPRLLAILLTGDRTVSVNGCITHLYRSGFLAATECYLLAVMSYDCPVIQLSCRDTRLTTLVTLILSSIETLTPFLLTLMSYVCIIVTILRIPSTKGRQKAFSTCSSHLAMVTMFYGTIIIVYVMPKNRMLRELNKVLSVFYTILTPLANPLIYSLRNKEIKEALRKALSKFMGPNSLQV